MTAPPIGERVECPACHDPNAYRSLMDGTVYCDRCHYFKRGDAMADSLTTSVAPTAKRPAQRTMEAFL